MLNTPGMVGYDNDAVLRAEKNIDMGIEQIQYAISEVGNYCFLMSRNWACKEAISFFDTLIQTYCDVCIKAGTKYNDILKVIEESRHQWAMATGTGFQPYGVTDIHFDVPDNNMQENINGIRGIDVKEAQNLTDIFIKLITVDFDNALRATTYSIQGAFLGKDQEEALFEVMRKADKSLRNEVEQFKSDLKNSMDKTVEKYGDTAGAVAKAFDADGHWSTDIQDRQEWWGIKEPEPTPEDNIFG